MAVTPEGAAAALVQRAQRRLDEIERRGDLLRQRALEAAQELRQSFGARRVFLFGSLAWGLLHEGSDVDLAAEGIPPSRLDEAAAEVSRIVAAPVDLHALETLPPSFAQRVLDEGILL